LKEIWKRILNGVNLGHGHKPNCICGEYHKTPTTPMKIFIGRDMDERPKESGPQGSDDNPPDNDDERRRYVPKGLS
jgi:hypothetical protein